MSICQKRTILLPLMMFFAMISMAQVYDLHLGIWGKIDSKVNPWARNASRPNRVYKGLADRHVALWASHGRYYDAEKGRWKWQRPFLYGTTEDLFTQTIVVPFLIPMLENSGAYVFTPRERDWQKEEIIVDNDAAFIDGNFYYEEEESAWMRAPEQGFRDHGGTYMDMDNPFMDGTARMTATHNAKRPRFASYQPNFRKAGRYAVYVSYPYLEDAIDDVSYIIIHHGVKTEVKVNQQMGWGTWVYVGTYEFGAGSSEDNRVVISAKSQKEGHIGTDAVRFGGGMGRMSRNGETSGMPRCLEGARYSAQWAGVPYSIYSTKNGMNDYGDDINVRSLMSNWLAGGSCYNPDSIGRKVPLELSLAVHSDAGFEYDNNSYTGSLAICTTNYNDGILPTGITRSISSTFAEMLLANLTRDLTDIYGKWNRRYLWDRNYSETRLPVVPSAIIETLSHQNFADMKMAHDPTFKFNVARSLYKTILRFICNQHNIPCVVQPLAPQAFSIELLSGNRARLTWKATRDSLESSAKPTSYNIYTRMGDTDFDNGENIKDNEYIIKLTPGIKYDFRVTACNDGGESFPTEVLSAFVSEKAQKTVLIVNGFQRLAAPQVIDNDSTAGFRLDLDEGVSYGLTAGWAGYQHVFDKKMIGIESESGLGFTGSELQGQFVMGNTFDYVSEHSTALAASGKYNIVSCTRNVFENGYHAISNIDAIDIILGMQKEDGYSLKRYKTFTPKMQQRIITAQKSGTSILVSGAYIGSDMLKPEEKHFMNNVFHIINTQDTMPERKSDIITGLGQEFAIYHTLSEEHIAATHPDIIHPTGKAISAMRYSDMTSAAVAYKDEHSATFAVGFPLECIKETTVRRDIFQGIMSYLTDK